MDRIPVFVFHKGNPDYLKKMVDFAVISNNEIHLVGNDENKNVSAIWANADDYLSDSFYEFEKAFIQLSDYSYDFDMMCFKRFYIMLEYMKKNKLDEMIFADSDMLIFTDLTEFFRKNKCKVSLSIPKRQENFRWAAQASCSYWTIEYLEDFLLFVIDMYKNHIDVLKEKYAYHIANAAKGGVCDMTLLYLWSREKEGVLNTAMDVDGVVLDHVVGRSDNYLDNEYAFHKILKVKKVKFKNKKPYFIRDDGTEIMAATIHCQGSTKSLIDELINYRFASFRMLFDRYTQGAKRMISKLGK